MLRLRHRALQGHLLRGGERRRAARGGRGDDPRKRIPALQTLHDARGNRRRRTAGIHGRGRGGGLYHAAGRRRRVRLRLYGERHDALRHRKGVAGGPHDLPQADLVPPLSDPPHALLERDGRAQLPPLVGLRPGARMRREAGHPGLQGAARTDRPPLRRGVLPRAGGRRRVTEKTRKQRKHRI